jgi:hypothetical protein
MRLRREAPILTWEVTPQDQTESKFIAGGIFSLGRRYCGSEASIKIWLEKEL